MVQYVKIENDTKRPFENTLTTGVNVIDFTHLRSLTHTYTGKKAAY